MRTALQALAAVLGGCQSLHTNGYDEAFAIPTEDAMRMALRTQQIIAEETNVASVVDPLGGSYFVESLTSEYEKRMFEILDEVDANGGAIKLIEEGWFQKQIADFAYDTALRKQSGEKPVIGVNRFVERRRRCTTSRLTHTTRQPRSARLRAPSAFAPSGTRQDTRALHGKARRGGEGRPAEHHADHHRAGPEGATMGEIVEA